ncbi:hypothetical protein J4772_20555 [Cohnella sp. LGH]|uniref:hypothetical protein n=1 Tax=Cohnella sp. LGH TaxID=1619153 RepID=UPI001AD9695F|nr:hypothetical protein [Cohnella sp. LGH]QTH40015.1 hypothetical protein J4772_20555 [Cohnella sp. LGH]
MRYTLSEGRDYDSVSEAVDRLLSDVMERMRAVKPDVMIEFRQKYIVPLMRKYGNMFRVADCLNNLLYAPLRPSAPDFLCPVVYTRDGRRYLAAVYGQGVVAKADVRSDNYLFVNGTADDAIIVQLGEELVGTMTVLDCGGSEISRVNVRLDEGVHRLKMPPSGLLHLRRSYTFIDGER